ncbi:F510_1955 family glycosylhydrolase [Micromonospora purpureochromogenes]|uniref:F510_1955 family glycosylhydrolase n=1 Tax=Micromonospora purpureochromogenes TaxID=47872 RepID=UPI0033303781
MALGLALLLATLNGCGVGSPSPATPHDEGFSHVHGLGVNPVDGDLYAATHHGVFRMTDSGPARVGEGRQDTMGFTVTGPNEFLASGHPAPGDDAPPHLGLIQSTDAGRTWRTLSLAGKADFHLLRESGGMVYGLDSTSGALLASADRSTWERRSTIEAFDLAVDPTRAATLVATTEQGLQRSTDGGRTWSPANSPAVLLLLHWSDRGLFAVTTDGRVVRSPDGASTWSVTGGRVPGTPAALTDHEDSLYLATQDARVLRSADGGATWQPLPS